MAIALSGSLNLSGSFTATGTITAQTLVVQTVTSSIDYVTGSTQWGSVIGNTHTITGSLGVSGSTSIIGNVGIGIASPTNLLTVQGIGALAMYTGSNVSVKINTTDNGSGYFQVVSAGVNTMYVGSQGSWEGNSGMNGAVASINGLNFYTNGSSTPKITISTVGAFTYNASVGGLYAFGVNGSGSFVYGSSTATRHASFSYNTGDKPGVELGYDVTNNNGIIAGATQANGAGLDFWTYNGSAWASRFTINKSGAATFSSSIYSSGGDLGIGTTTPETFSGYRTAEISATAGGIVFAKSTTGSITTQLVADNGPNMGYVGTRTNHAFSIRTNNTDKLTIASTGAATFSSSVTASEAFLLTPVGGSLYAQNGALAYYSTTNGVYLNGAGPSGWLRLNAAGSENNQTNIDMYGSAYTPSASTIIFRTANSERMRITGGGQLLVGGISSSSSMVEINGGSTSYGGGNGHLKITSAATGQTVLNISNTSVPRSWEFAVGGSASGIGSGVFYIYDNTAGVARMVIGTNGNILVGTTTDVGARLHVNGNIVASGTGSQNGLLTRDNNNSTTYGFVNNGAGSLTLTNSGVANVGHFTMSTGVYTADSDSTLKKNIVDAKSAINVISNIRVRSYNWKYDNTYEPFGVIAQELYEVAPTYASKPILEGGHWGVSKAEMVPMLIKGMQEQQAQIEELKSQNDDLQQQINELKAQ